MGVVYKVKQEVVDFIVHKKKEDPFLSCRKLVEIIKVDFSVDVSKSSVNAVIKQFNLSSPVGRQPVYKPSKNFSIPQDKKALLLANMAPFLKNPETVPPLDSTKVEPPVPETVVTEAKAPVQEEQEQKVVEAKPAEVSSPPPEPVSSQEQEAPAVALSLPPDTLRVNQEKSADLLPEVLVFTTPEVVGSGREPGVWTGDLGAPKEGLGLFLLPLALWDIEAKPTLGEILAKHLSYPTNADTFEKLEIAASIFAMIGIDGENVNLESISEFLSAVGFDKGEFSKIMEDVSLLGGRTGWEQEVRAHVLSQMVMAEAIKVLTEDGHIFYVDPAFLVCSEDGGLVRRKLSPLYTTVNKAVDAFITNTNPIVIGPAALSGELLIRFCEAMEGEFGRGIKAVEVLGLDGGKVFESTNVFIGRKAYVVKADLTEEQMGSFDAEMIDNSHKYVEPLFGQEIEYHEGSVCLKPGMKRVKAILLKTKGSKRITLLTNIEQKEGVFIDFYEKLVNSDEMPPNETYPLKNSETVGFDIKKYDNFVESKPFSYKLKIVRDLFNEYLSRINNIDVYEIESGFFSKTRLLKGYFRARAKKIYIQLQLTNEFPFEKELRITLNYLNAREVKDRSGRTVHISLVTS